MEPKFVCLSEGDTVRIIDKTHPHCGAVATVQKVAMYAVIVVIPVGRDESCTQMLTYDQFVYAHPGPFMEM